MYIYIYIYILRTRRGCRLAGGRPRRSRRATISIALITTINRIAIATINRIATINSQIYTRINTI